MPLNAEFRQMIEDNIQTVLLTVPTLKKEYPKFKQDWKFEHEFDFLYGSVIGQILGGSLTAFKMIYLREATSEEILEIGEIVESYFDKIRDSISKAN
ncbi:MAG: hypothetical protein ACREAE_08905 [Nitrosopumilaceae archaeon]